MEENCLSHNVTDNPRRRDHGELMKNPKVCVLATWMVVAAICGSGAPGVGPLMISPAWSESTLR